MLHKIPPSARDAANQTLLRFSHSITDAMLESAEFSFNSEKTLKMLGPFELIVHVGAHRGQEFKNYRRLGAKKIVWIEANPLFIDDLHKLARKFTNVEQHVCQELVSSKNDSNVKFHIYSNEGASSSIYLPTKHMTKNFPKVRPTGQSIIVRTRTLSSILKELSFIWENVGSSLLVIDTQGSESKVIESLSPDTFSRFGHVLCEISTVPLYEGSPATNELLDMFRTRGFRPITKIPRFHGDVIFAQSSKLL